MAKAQNGDWAAFTVNGGIRFTYKKTMVKKSQVPPAIKQYFEAVPEIASDIAPSPEFQAEQAKQPEQPVAPPAQPEPPQAPQATQIPVSTPTNPALAPDDFSDEPSPSDVAAVAAAPQPAPLPLPEPVQQPAQPAPLPVAPPQPAVPPQPAPVMQPSAPQAIPPAQEVSQATAPAPFVPPNMWAEQPAAPAPAPLPGQFPVPPERPLTAAPAPGMANTPMTIFDAPLHDIARALNERFGVYTVFLGRAPEPDEISPTSAIPMSNYDRGLAYQAFLRVEASGLLNQDFTAVKAQLDHSKQLSADFQNNFAPPTGLVQPTAPTQPGDPGSFAYRTSPEATLHGSGMRSKSNPEDESNPVAEPPLNSPRPIIKPQW